MSPRFTRSHDADSLTEHDPLTSTPRQKRSFADPLLKTTFIVCPRVTKLPLDTLKQLAKTTPVFAPGLDHLLQMGAVAEIWDPTKPLDEQLEETLKKASPVPLLAGDPRNPEKLGTARLPGDRAETDGRRFCG
jgi:hypothetical protein